MSESLKVSLVVSIRFSWCAGETSQPMSSESSERFVFNKRLAREEQMVVEVLYEKARNSVGGS